ncbi:hypothetical protein P8891_05770 [Bacillus atrophaeus]|uniref:hypothetical protein n=1 Tax=Bacillus atrophaeus TaxID=1452 RepID=UPI00227FE8F3|nr:hypothetical protein [Bacillus atrophaeus]MCY7947937.1 hypothetical protein [Bacillus atrophaeus]MCY8098264.1 hypothetical protein [Bacillus atrophaeus]MCY9170041.1 hypothetical protein [Bacillus atrophaeus]MEC0740595.1 hypothetical protein [Bacillus atrophaeus]MEC0746969.1 hypothetical protein [Bacillus atrophaeus]
MLKHLEEIINLEDFDYITNEEFKALSSLKNKSFKESLKENDIGLLENDVFGRVICDFIGTSIHMFLCENNFFKDDELLYDKPICGYDEKDGKTVIENEVLSVFKREGNEYQFYVELSIGIEDVETEKALKKILAEIESQIIQRPIYINKEEVRV